MPQFNFGSGLMFGSRTDIANATPVQFGVLQDVSLDFSFTQKDLMGQYQLPVASARAGAKLTGKAKFAQISARGFNDMFFGQTLTTSASDSISANEVHSVPASTPYTVTAANSATWTGDLGVLYTATGLALVKVASDPTQGQYSVASGVYTFAAADTGASVNISYAYTLSTGNKIVLTNQLMGTSPIFKMTLFETYAGNQALFELNQCISTKLSFDFKNEDWTVPEFDFSIFCDASNTLGTMSFTD